VARRGFNKAAVALANKNARILWAMASNGKDYEALVMDAASDAMGSSEPLETPVAFYLYIHMPIPKSYSKKLRQDCLDGIEKPIKKPDWDNIAKAVTDALNGIVYVDDCQIVTAHVKKAYSDTPRIEVLIQEEIE
jgi:Holliday junction resolvase RusA-like endonuclease